MLVKFESEVLTVNNQIISVVILNSRNDNCNIGSLLVFQFQFRCFVIADA